MPRRTLRLPVIGLCLVVAVGALVYLVEQTGPSQPHDAAAARTTPAAIVSPSPERPTPSATPAPERTAPPDPLRTAASYLAARSGTVLAEVYDRSTRQTWKIGSGGRVQAEASVVKVDILEALFAQHRGGLSANDQALAQRMIEDSDNDAATALWNTVGGASGLRAFNAAIGLTATTPSSCVQCPGFPWPGWGLSTTTPADQIALLRELVEPSSFIDNEERYSALRLMENVTPEQRWGVSGGVPAHVIVALKNGWLPLNGSATDWQINSVGWVYGLGRDYLIAVLSTGNPTEAYGIDTIDGVSAMVWNDLG